MKQHKIWATIIKDVDEKGRVLVAANAIGNKDADGDISQPGSFTKTLSENFSRARWFLNHDREKLLGVPIEGKEQDGQLQILGQLNMTKQIAQDTYSDYKLYAEYGRSLEHSVGVEAIKKDQKDNARNVYEWKLWEYSTLTGWGANERTPMLGIKSLDDFAEAVQWLELKLKKGNYTDDRFREIEKQLIIIRSLCTEPDDSTQMTKPNEDLNKIFKKLNVFDDGTRTLEKVGEICGSVR